MPKPILLTDEGLRNLETEIERLKTVTRQEIADKIKVARGFGDLSENSEYDEAKNEQAKIEARILEIETMLKNVQIIDEDEITTSQVMVGSCVKLLDVEYNEEIIYRIVGSAEADPRKGKISDEAPVGAALLGRSAGEDVTVETPAGYLTFRIIEITR